MELRYLADPIRYAGMSTEELRKAFLVEALFRPGEIDLVYLDLDRTIVGSAVPLKEALVLPNEPELRARCFTERREVGILNVGSSGVVTVNNQRYPLDRLDALYVGRGEHEVIFESAEADSPAEFYLLSYPAHHTFPTQVVKSKEQESTTIGSPSTANERSITKLIHSGATRSCQLVMGFTRLSEGSVWNTMPPHTHSRRSEVYLYFGLPAGERVIHLLGPSHETRHLVVANKQIAISPGWSIHSGVGTSAYYFCWGMGGENQAYDDMDKLEIADLR